MYGIISSSVSIIRCYLWRKLRKIQYVFFHNKNRRQKLVIYRMEVANVSAVFSQLLVFRVSILHCSTSCIGVDRSPSVTVIYVAWLTFFSRKSTCWRKLESRIATAREKERERETKEHKEGGDCDKNTRAPVTTEIFLASR